MILNRTAECAAPNKRYPDLSHLRYLVIHRTSLSKKGPDNPEPVSDEDLDAATLAHIFKANDLLGTGNQVPYHILIHASGRAEQMMPLTSRGAHAVGYNSQSIAVACIGDFIKADVPATQMRSLSRVCAALAIINKGLVIGGHTSSFEGSSHDAKKVCPGERLSIPKLVEKVTERLPPNWRHHTPDEVVAMLKLGGYVI